MASLTFQDMCFAYDDRSELSGRRHRGRGNESASENSGRKLVLKHLDLKVPKGQFLCLVGHSGCGKTTLLRTLAGLERPTAGRAFIDDREIDGPGLDRGVVFQNYSLFPWMKAIQNVEFGVRQASLKLGRNLGKREIRDIAREYLAKVNMSKAEDLYPYQLSGGMQQRVAIARTLAMDTDILLFDEPFGALDVRTRRDLQTLMQELWMASDKARTAVFVTHDIEEAILLADRIMFMSGGRFQGDFEVEAPRPRDPDGFTRTPEFLEPRSRLLELFYNAEETKMDQSERERVYTGGSVL